MRGNITPNRLALYLLLIILSASSVQAQSGRRQNKTTPAAPIPTPTPEPTPTPTRQKAEPDIGFLVTMSTQDSFASYPLSFASAVLHSCADRLGTASSASVNVSQQDINRAEASKKAKGETKTFVVWLQLSQSTMGSSTSSNRYADLELDYVVFQPGTGKIATSGRTYQNGNRRGPIINPRGSTSVIYTEQLLKYAAEDAADRILRALHLSSSDPTHPVIMNLR